MSSIDLIILGIVMERPQSAYDIQKDVQYHNLSRWTKISVPSVYKKVLQLKEKGYLKSTDVKGSRSSGKAVYTVTDKGKTYFEQLMDTYASQSVSFLFDFNVVVINLNKMKKDKALDLIGKLKNSIAASARTNDTYAAEYSDIPLAGRTVFDQQKLLYHSLLKWLGTFEKQFKAEC